MKYYQIICIQNFTQNPQVLIFLRVLDAILGSSVSHRAWFWTYYGWGLFQEYGGRSSVTHWSGSVLLLTVSLEGSLCWSIITLAWIKRVLLKQIFQSFAFTLFMLMSQSPFEAHMLDSFWIAPKWKMCPRSTPNAHPPSWSQTGARTAGRPTTANASELSALPLRYILFPIILANQILKDNSFFFFFFFPSPTSWVCKSLLDSHCLTGQKCSTTISGSSFLGGVFWNLMESL